MVKISVSTCRAHLEALEPMQTFVSRTCALMTSSKARPEAPQPIEPT